MKNFKDSFTQLQQEGFVENFLLIEVTEETSYSFEVAFIPRTIEVLYDSIGIVE